MLSLALGLSLAAIIVIVIDVFLEGFGILGVVGLLLLAASIFVNIVHVPFGVYIVIGQAAVLIPASVFFVRYLKRKQIYGKLILNETLAEDRQDFSGLQELLNQEGVTKTALRPFGHAEFNGVNVEAVCADSKYIPANKRVKAVGLKDKYLFVRVLED